MFKVFIDVKKVEDDFENGEIGEPKEVFSSNSNIGEGASIKEAIENALRNLGLLRKASWREWQEEIIMAIDEAEELDQNFNNFTVYFNEKENGERVLSAEDEAAWRKRELKVLTVMYNFTICEERPVPASRVKSFLKN